MPARVLSHQQSNGPAVHRKVPIVTPRSDGSHDVIGPELQEPIRYVIDARNKRIQLPVRRVVDEYVHRTICFFGTIEHHRNDVRIREVAFESFGLATCLTNGAHHRISGQSPTRMIKRTTRLGVVIDIIAGSGWEAQVLNEDKRALRCKRHRSRHTNAMIPSSDQNDLSSELGINHAVESPNVSQLARGIVLPNNHPYNARTYGWCGEDRHYKGMVTMEFDVLIRNGQVIDGSKDAIATAADIGIKGDRIEAIGKLEDATAATTIDAQGKVVSPGFIDVHIHSEIELLGGEHRFASLLQGVTTQLLTPDGFGWAPLTPDQARDLWEATVAIYGPLKLDPNWPTPESYLKLFEGSTPANVLPQVPHTAVRLAAMGWDPRPATDDELDTMRGLVRQWMEAGATCLCLGLDYQPSAFADTRELIELSKVAGEYDGIYTAHIRNNEIGRAAAWRETFEIGEKSGIPVHFSHEYVDDLTGPLLDEANGVYDVTFESYMYPAGCTHLLNLLPIALQAGGPDGIKQRLSDPAARKQIHAHFEQRIASDKTNGRWGVFANTHTGRYIGKSITEAADEEDMPPADFLMKVFDEEYPEGLMVYHRGGTDEQINDMVKRTISHPMMMVASDGIYHGPHAHPRGYGCFSRALRLGVRELGAVSVEEAVYKMSGFPAERFRIKDRGLLKEGMAADVVVFDPATVADRSTWEEPRLEPVGIDKVLVNGKTVIDSGIPTGEIPGKVLG